MCGHISGTTQGVPIKSDDYKLQFKSIFEQFDFADIPMVCIYNAGSFFNDTEMPKDAREYMIDCLSKEKEIKYIVFDKNRPVACLGWGDASWQLKVRDKWIGWNASQRTRKLHLLVNNVRFLILPWVIVPNFASYILAKCSRAVVNDWEQKNAFRPVLLETFVDTKKFIGTCYRAANWTELGTTSGYAKRGSYHYNSQSPKTLYVYPVNKKFSALLKGRGK